MPDPTMPERPAEDNFDQGPYRIADEVAAPSTRPQPTAPQRGGAAPRGAAEIDGEGDGEGEGDFDANGSLPPPISRPTHPKVWLLIAGVCAALIFISWLAGAQQLALPDAKGAVAELGFGDRVQGILRTAIFIPLATLSAVFGLAALAFLHQRPLGDAAGLFAKSLAIIAVACLLWLVPSDIRFVKQALHVLGVPLAAAALAVPVFRLHPRDAAIATGCAVLGMLLLFLGSWAVVWSAS